MVTRPGSRLGPSKQSGRGTRPRAGASLERLRRRSTRGPIGRRRPTGRAADRSPPTRGSASTDHIALLGLEASQASAMKTAGRARSFGSARGLRRHLASRRVGSTNHSRRRPRPQASCRGVGGSGPTSAPVHPPGAECFRGLRASPKPPPILQHVGRAILQVGSCRNRTAL